MYGVKTQVFYNPTQGVLGHPLEIYAQNLQCQCANMAGLFRGLIRSIGIDGTVYYYWGGLNSTQKRTYSGVGQNGLTLRLEEMATEDLVLANPHFAFHALVSANGTIYDPSYGKPRPSMTILETAFMTTPLQTSTTYPSQPDSYSGWNCGH